jgi:hypothetical protein
MGGAVAESLPQRANGGGPDGSGGYGVPGAPLPPPADGGLLGALGTLAYGMPATAGNFGWQGWPGAQQRGAPGIDGTSTAPGFPTATFPRRQPVNWERVADALLAGLSPPAIAEKSGWLPVGPTSSGSASSDSSQPVERPSGGQQLGFLETCPLRGFYPLPNGNKMCIYQCTLQGLRDKVIPGLLPCPRGPFTPGDF